MIPHVIINPGGVRGELRATLIPELTTRFGGTGNDRATFTLYTAEHDPRIPEVIEFLESRGVRRMPEAWDYALEKSPTGFYTMMRVRVYEAVDYSQAEYLWLESLIESSLDIDTDGNRNAEGLWQIVSGSIPRRGRLMSAGRNILFVSDAFRAELEAERFVGMGFAPTKQVREKKSGETYICVPHQPAADRVLWELRPTVHLPRMHPEVLRTQLNPKVPVGDPGPGNFQNDGFDDVQLVYARSALASVGAFDMAHTWEYKSAPENRCFIISQRFYQFCKAKKLPCHFVPVKIVEGE